jgi:hypothetical protein
MTNTTRRSRKPIHDDFDGAWKNMLSEKRFSQFIEFFMPEVHDQIDWIRQVAFLEQELRAITRKTKRGHRAVDRLVKVWLKDGTEKWVLIHIEIQSQEDPGFPLRMFQYYYRGRDLFPDRSMACLAILGDDNEAWKPGGYVDALWQTRVEFVFRVVKLKEYERHLEELEHSANPFARFTLAHLKTVQTRGDYETRLQWKLRIIKGLYGMGVPEAEIGQLYHDFDWLLALPDTLAIRYHREMARFEEEQTMPHLSTAERIGRKIGRKEGREEGREEGRVQEARMLLLRLGSKRFGDPGEQVRVALEAISSLEALEKLADSLLEAENWNELLNNA